MVVCVHFFRFLCGVCLVSVLILYRFRTNFGWNAYGLPIGCLWNLCGIRVKLCIRLVSALYVFRESSAEDV